MMKTGNQNTRSPGHSKKGVIAEKVAVRRVMKGKLPCERGNRNPGDSPFLQNTVNLLDGTVVVLKMLQAVTHQNLIGDIRRERPRI